MNKRSLLLLMSLTGTMLYAQEKEKEHPIDVDAIRHTELTGDIGLPPTEMNKVATSAQVNDLLKKYPGKKYLTFPEDRENSIRMLDALPIVWTQRSAGELSTFKGTARPGEYYVFQIGVYAARAAMKNITVNIPSLKNTKNQLIKEVTCFNSEGTSYLGKPFKTKLELAEKRVLPLWFGVQIPKNATGTYTGQVIIKDDGQSATSVAVVINVAGKPAVNNGFNEPKTLSRMAWLNSVTDLDNDITKGYKPVVRKDRSISILGRTTQLGADGLPVTIKSFFDINNHNLTKTGEDILNSPVRFIVEKEGQAMKFQTSPIKFTDHLPGSTTWETKLVNPELNVVVKGHAEFDGYMQFEMLVKPLKDVKIKDVRLEVPFHKEKSVYMMGLGKEGGTRPDSWKWKWDVKEKNQDAVWLGGVNGGLRVRLKGANFVSNLVNIYYQYGPLNEPESWGNNNKGGMKISEQNGGVLLDAFSGDRTLKKDSTYNFTFELLVTPFHLINREIQYNERYFHSDIDTSTNYIKLAKEHGANTINIHHKKDIYPWIDYPFSDDNVDSLKLFIENTHKNNLKTKLYYTTREISLKSPEIWAMRALNNEILYPGPGMKTVTLVNPRGPHPWYKDNFKEDFFPGWVATFEHGKFKGQQDLAVLTGPDTRLNNFYVEGLKWLCDNLKIDGLYIDDLALDRETLKRSRKILDRRRPGSKIDMHTWNHYNQYGAWGSSLNLYMHLLPSIDHLWVGEARDYNKPADYWLVEVSGIPFGLTSQMLNKGGNPWRGMVFGMTARLGWFRYKTPEYMWKFWDEYNFTKKTMIGFWNKDVAVKTDNKNTEATIYQGDGEIVIAVANWTDKAQTCKLTIDWKKTGLSPDNITVKVPAIKEFQEETTLDINGPINIAPEQGYLIVIKKK